MFVQTEDGVAQQQCGRDVSGQQQNGRKADDFGVAQALAINFGCDEVGDEILAWSATTVTDVLP